MKFHYNEILGWEELNAMRELLKMHERAFWQALILKLVVQWMNWSFNIPQNFHLKTVGVPLIFFITCFIQTKPFAPAVAHWQRFVSMDTLLKDLFLPSFGNVCHFSSFFPVAKCTFWTFWPLGQKGHKVGCLVRCFTAFSERWEGGKRELVSVDFAVPHGWSSTGLDLHPSENSFQNLHLLLFFPFFFFFIADRREGIGVCGWILISLSFLLVLITFPISIWACIKVS